MSATTCRANAASPPLRRTCWRPWPRSRKPNVSLCRSMTSRAATNTRTWCGLKSRSRSCHRTSARRISSTSATWRSCRVQHEFGIYGGPAGSHLLALLRELRMPVVTTLHTVLREPNADQRRVMQELIARSARLVVMAERGRQILAGRLPGAGRKDRSDPARHTGHAVCRSELLQGPVWRGGQDGAADVRAALAEQGH